MAGVISFVVLAWSHAGQGWSYARPARPERRLLRQALPLGLALLLNVLYFRIDALLLSLLRPAREVALYGFAYRLLEVVLALGAFVLASLLPVMSAAVTDPERWRRLALSSFRFFQALGLLVASCGALEAGRLAALVGGPTYRPAGHVLAVLLLSGALSWVNGFGGIMLISKDLQGRALWLNVTALVVNVGANLVLVPRYGYLAAAWVTVLSELVNFAGMVLLVDRLGGYRWRGEGWAAALVLTVAAVVTDLATRAAGAHVLLSLASATAVWGIGAVRLDVLPQVVLRRTSEVV
jgi:O-antigen/teichoic acid export membrane protein